MPAKLSEEDKIRGELGDIVKSELTQHYDAILQMLKQKGYSEEKIRKVLTEEIEKPPGIRAKEVAAIVAKDLHIPVQKPAQSPNSPSPQIYLDEMKTPIDEIIRREAIEIWKKEKRGPPPEQFPQEILDRAMINVLKRWQKTLREVRETIPKMAPPPEMPPEMVKKAAPTCPICGQPMRKIVGRLYQCPKHPTQTRLLPEA
jgi:hypothetical protein